MLALLVIPIQKKMYSCFRGSRTNLQYDPWYLKCSSSNFCVWQQTKFDNNVGIQQYLHLLKQLSSAPSVTLLSRNRVLFLGHGDAAACDAGRKLTAPSGVCRLVPWCTRLVWVRQASQVPDHQTCSSTVSVRLCAYRQVCTIKICMNTRDTNPEAIIFCIFILNCWMWNLYIALYRCLLKACLKDRLLHIFGVKRSVFFFFFSLSLSSSNTSQFSFSGHLITAEQTYKNCN